MITLIPEIKILISLIVLPEITCVQPLCQLTVLSQQIVVGKPSSVMGYGGNEIVRKVEINDGHSINVLSLLAVTDRPAISFSSERFEYPIENIDYEAYRLDESFSIRSPGADYDSSNRNDIDLSPAGLNDDIKELTLLIKPLQLLNLLAKEDVTIYEAADILRISVHTANKYVAKIKSEFGVLTLPAAVLFAATEGLISKPADKII